MFWAGEFVGNSFTMALLRALGTSEMAPDDTGGSYEPSYCFEGSNSGLRHVLSLWHGVVNGLRDRDSTAWHPFLDIFICWHVTLGQFISIERVTKLYLSALRASDWA